MTETLEARADREYSLAESATMVGLRYLEMPLFCVRVKDEGDRARVRSVLFRAAILHHNVASLSRRESRALARRDYAEAAALAAERAAARRAYEDALAEALREEATS